MNVRVCGLQVTTDVLVLYSLRRWNFYVGNSKYYRELLIFFWYNINVNVYLLIPFVKMQNISTNFSSKS